MTTQRQQRLDALVDAGVRRQQEGDLAAAAGWYQRALALDPGHIDALQLLGLVRVQGGNLEAGIDLLRRSLAVEPNQVVTLNNLGGALRAAGRMSEAIAAFRQALEVHASHPSVLINLGSALLESGETREAAVCLNRALEADQSNPDIYFWIGQLYRRLGHSAEAVLQFRHALRLAPNLEGALRGLGLALEECGDALGALQAFRSAEALSPTLAARVYRAYAALRVADWDGWSGDAKALARPDLTAPDVGDPFRVMSLPATPELLRHATEHYVSRVAAGALLSQRPAMSCQIAPRPRIRVGYLSPDFRNHAVGNIVAEVLELHDAERFEVYGYAWGPRDHGAVRARIESACDKFQDISDLSDAAAAQRLAADEVDIAVDLAGYTAHCRPLIFAARCARLQVGWLGYPGTSGAPYMDYFLADGFTVPIEAERHFTERVVRLPEAYLPYDRTRMVGPVRSPAEYELPPQRPLLACFAHVSKINPPIFDIWMHVLRAAETAVLWLAVSDATAIANLRRHAQARGVSADRLVFCAPVKEGADHLARYQLVDLALDTFPYGAHSTAADALWAGCPLVAISGATVASRVSGAVLRAAGLAELLTDSFEAYQQLIIELLRNPSRLTSLRARVQTLRSQCALFDTPRFALGLERAYHYMWSRHERGETPASFSVVGAG